MIESYDTRHSAMDIHPNLLVTGGYVNFVQQRVILRCGIKQNGKMIHSQIINLVY